MATNKWKIDILPVFKGYAKNWFNDKFGTYGYDNQSNYMKNIDLTDINCFTQGYGIKTATGGDTASKFYEIRPMGSQYLIATSQSSANNGYVNIIKTDLGASNKLSIVSSTAITGYQNTNDYPCSCSRYNSTDYFYFYNTATGGDIGKAVDIDTNNPVYTHDWGSNTKGKTLQNAPHPVIQYGGKMIFGNGRYLGVYNGTDLDAERYNFSDITGVQSSFVADLCVNDAYVYVGVNNGDTAYSENSVGEINIINYDLAPDDLNQYVILKKISVHDTIGAMIAIDGVVYVIHGNQLSNTFSIGYINGDKIKELKSFTGKLPRFHQLDYVNNRICWTNGTEIYSLIDLNDEYGTKILQSVVSAKYNNVDSVCNINGLTIITSHNDSNNYDVSYIDGKTNNCIYRTITKNVSDGLTISTIKNIGIETNPLGAGARCDVYVLINQIESRIPVMTLEGTGISRHTPHKNLDIHDVESFCLEFDFTNGSSTDLVKIRKININGEYGERN